MGADVMADSEVGLGRDALKGLMEKPILVPVRRVSYGPRTRILSSMHSPRELLQQKTVDTIVFRCMDFRMCNSHRMLAQGLGTTEFDQINLPGGAIDLVIGSRDAKSILYDAIVLAVAKHSVRQAVIDIHSAINNRQMGCGKAAVHGLNSKMCRTIWKRFASVLRTDVTDRTGVELVRTTISVHDEDGEQTDFCEVL